MYLAFILYFSIFNDCYNKLQEQVYSPDGKYKVRYFTETCESKPSEIKIWLGESNSDTSLLIFSAIATTTNKIQLTWVNNHELKVIYPGALDPTTINAKPKNVFIKYKRASNNST